MTQGAQHSTRSYEFTPAYIARITPQVRPVARKRYGGGFLESLRTLAREILPHREEEVPDSLLEDVGLDAHAHAARRRSEFNRLDAQLHARIF